MTSVAETIAQTLKAYDTKYFFQVTGGDQALWIALEGAGIQMIPCRSEKGAVYMADGYARISGKPGFVYGQYGPGVSNVAAGQIPSLHKISLTIQTCMCCAAMKAEAATLSLPALAQSACATRMPYTAISQISRLLYKKSSLKGCSCLPPRLGQSPR
jgi:glyoxylate carboligase